MMKPDNLENELRNLKFTHLSEDELAAYCDQELDPLRRHRAEAHLKQCFICERQLAVLREESAALNNHQIDADDIALVERLMNRMPMAQTASHAYESADRETWQERLADYLRQMAASWQSAFQRPVKRGKEPQGKSVWQWQSADGRLQAHARIEENADLTLRFSTNDLALEGVRLKVTLGLMTQEITLQRVSETEVAASVAVPWQYRQGNMANLVVESL